MNIAYRYISKVENWQQGSFHFLGWWLKLCFMHEVWYYTIFYFRMIVILWPVMTSLGLCDLLWHEFAFSHLHKLHCRTRPRPIRILPESSLEIQCQHSLCNSSGYRTRFTGMSPDNLDVLATRLRDHKTEPAEQLPSQCDDLDAHCYQLSKVVVPGKQI